MPLCWHAICLDIFDVIKAKTVCVYTGDCKLLAAKAACAAHLFGPEFPYVKAAGSNIEDWVKMIYRKVHVRCYGHLNIYNAIHKTLKL
jgi:hypothetical protein